MSDETLAEVGRVILAIDLDRVTAASHTPTDAAKRGQPMSAAVASPSPRRGRRRAWLRARSIRGGA
jgi:hypothetical protein